MNYDGVPDHFDETEHDYAANINPMSSGFSSHKAAANENEIMEELLWQNGQVMVQKSSKRSSTTPSVGAAAAVIPAEQPVVREIRSAEEQQHLFMQEDEMASWLHYPVLDESSNFSRDFYGTDLFYSTQPPPASTADGAEIRQPLVPPRQPIPPPAAENISSPSQLQNFVHFSRLPSKPITSKPSAITPTDLTVGESNDTPMAGKESSVPYSTADDCRRQANTEGVTAAAPANRELANAVTCELTAATSSPSGSGTSFSASAEARPPTPKQDPPAADVADGKRKDRETDDNEYRNEDIEIEVNRQAGRTTSASTKRSRAAEVHNQSERRRRDRINEKMKALQELIPRCNKSDKASMLDEAIEYLKSLQMQVQMMSMGCGGMVPMMYPGMQQYMPAMGMGMGMGMNQTMLPYPSSMLQVPAGSAMPNPAAHIGPRTPIPGFHMPQHHTRIQPSNHHDLMINSLLSHNASHQPMQNLVDPYQQFGQLPIPQNQAMMQHNIKPSISKEVGDPENKQSGRKWL